MVELLTTTFLNQCIAKTDGNMSMGLAFGFGATAAYGLRPL